MWVRMSLSLTRMRLLRRAQALASSFGCSPRGLVQACRVLDMAKQFRLDPVSFLLQAAESHC